jgi:hypothetical protein
MALPDWLRAVFINNCEHVLLFTLQYFMGLGPIFPTLPTFGYIFSLPAFSDRCLYHFLCNWSFMNDFSAPFLMKIVNGNALLSKFSHFINYFTY